MQTLKDFDLNIIDIADEPDENGNYKVIVDMSPPTVRFLTSYGLRHLLITSATRALEENEIYESDIYSEEGC